MSALNPITSSSSLPDHLQRGQHGEKLARRFLQRRGLKYLTRNYASVRGEIDLLFRECQTLVFVEVRTRTGEQWQSPAASVDRAKKRRLMHAAKDYLQELEVVVPYHRFDIVEVILKRNRGLVTIRHIAGAFVSEILSPQGNH